jgi:hypothetical protein
MLRPRYHRCRQLWIKMLHEKAYQLAHACMWDLGPIVRNRSVEFRYM